MFKRFEIEGVGRERGPGCGTCSGPMLRNVCCYTPFVACVRTVKRKGSPCDGTYTGPILGDMFGAHVVGHVRNTFYRMCSDSGAQGAGRLVGAPGRGSTVLRHSKQVIATLQKSGTVYALTLQRAS